MSAGGAGNMLGRRPKPSRIAAIISPTVSASRSAVMNGRRNGADVFRTTSIAADKFSNASRERRPPTPRNGSGNGERASRISCAMLPLTPGP